MGENEQKPFDMDDLFRKTRSEIEGYLQFPLDQGEEFEEAKCLIRPLEGMVPARYQFRHLAADGIEYPFSEVAEHYIEAGVELFTAYYSRVRKSIVFFIPLQDGNIERVILTKDRSLVHYDKGKIGLSKNYVRVLIPAALTEYVYGEPIIVDEYFNERYIKVGALIRNIEVSKGMLDFLLKNHSLDTGQSKQPAA